VHHGHDKRSDEILSAWSTWSPDMTPVVLLVISNKSMLQSSTSRVDDADDFLLAIPTPDLHLRPNQALTICLHLHMEELPNRLSDLLVLHVAQG
jgi:hypothetical protein